MPFFCSNFAAIFGVVCSFVRYSSFIFCLNMNENKDNVLTNSDKDVSNTLSLDDIIRNAEFPDDYDVFEDSQLDMIP